MPIHARINTSRFANAKLEPFLSPWRESVKRKMLKPLLVQRGQKGTSLRSAGAHLPSPHRIGLLPGANLAPPQAWPCPSTTSETLLVPFQLIAANVSKKPKVLNPVPIVAAASRPGTPQDWNGVNLSQTKLERH